MTKRLFLFPMALAALGGHLLAQGAAAPNAAPGKAGTPLTEKDLLRTLDNLSVGDPIKQQPLSARDGLDLDLRKKKDEPAAKLATKPSGETEITSKEATFDQRKHLAIFLQEVVVVHPEFTMTCDKLTAFLKHADAPNAAPDPALAPAKPGGPAAGAKSTGKGGKADGGGLERAIAEGNVVITQDKVEADGNVVHNVGRGKKAIYEAASGDIVLSGMPEVSHGFNSLVATAESTVITMNREGQTSKADGPSKTVIKDTATR